MGLQKYRNDLVGEPYPNGSVSCYAKWIGGPSLALIRNCPVETRIPEPSIEPRTVYIQGEPDSYFSQPAACKYKGKTLRGYISFSTDGKTGPVFHTTLNPTKETDQ